jgi:hypothetical protein
LSTVPSDSEVAGATAGPAQSLGLRATRRGGEEPPRGRIQARRAHLVEGPVEETIPQVAPNRIVILRFEIDWYESTKHELVHLYDRIEPGEFLFVADYGYWQAARRAVDESFESRAEGTYMMRIDYTGRLVLKRKARG